MNPLSKLYGKPVTIALKEFRLPAFGLLVECELGDDWVKLIPWEKNAKVDVIAEPVGGPTYILFSSIIIVGEIKVNDGTESKEDTSRSNGEKAPPPGATPYQG